MTSIDGNAHSKFDADLHNIQLAAVNGALKSSAVPKNINMSGVMNGQADAAWGKTFDDVVAHADATLQAKVSRTATAFLSLLIAQSTAPTPEAISKSH